MTNPVIDAFENLLTRLGIQHAVNSSGQGLVVSDNLDLREKAIWELPDDLRVHGWMDISHTSIAQLPARLFVQKTLFMTSTSCALSADLHVGQDVNLSRSTITTLPDNFRVIGTLTLQGSTITVLPEGLDVGGDLDLQSTGIIRFPRMMRVGQMILPPPNLHDVHAFMDARTDPVCLSLAGSAHHRVSMQKTLQPFPDLMRIVQSVAPDRKVVLARIDTGVSIKFPMI